MTRSPLKATALLLLALLMAGASWAQDLRPTETLYFTPKIGITSYIGDLNSSFNGNEYSVDGRFPLSGQLEIGYQYTPNFSVAVGGGVAYFPGLIAPLSMNEDSGNPALFNRFKDFGQSGFRYPLYLITRFQTAGNFSPYAEIGAGAMIGNTADYTPSATGGGTKFALGPQVGFGFDYYINKRTAFTMGVQSLFSFADTWFDGAADQADGAAGVGVDFQSGVEPGYQPDLHDFASFDLVSNLTFGLKFNNKKAFTAVDVLSIDGPSTLQVGQSGTYEAMVDMNATQPVEYRWDFGDGNMGTGLVATHSYDRPGTYTVTFTASNGRSMDSESMTTTVVAPPVAASVVSINSTPNPSMTGQTVRFSSNVRGDTPLDYTWNFGDGTTGTGANPTHVYSQPGTYTVSLTVRNNAGSDTATLTQVVNPAMTANPCADIAELNSAYFMNNSSVLTAEALDHARLRLHHDAYRRLRRTARA